MLCSLVIQSRAFFSKMNPKSRPILNIFSYIAT